MRTCTRRLKFSSEILSRIFAPAFHERMLRQVWTRPHLSQWLCLFWLDWMGGGCFFLLARKLHSRPRPRYPDTCPGWTFWRYQCHEDILLGRISGPGRTLSAFLADSHQRALGRGGECRMLCRLCQPRFSIGTL